MKKPSLQNQLEATQLEVKRLEKEIEKSERKKRLKKEAERKRLSNIKTLPNIYKELGVSPKKDVIKIGGFDKEDHEVLENIVARMRICKVYNANELPTGAQQRWYPWHKRNSSNSNLIFHTSAADGINADIRSAVRLSFLRNEDSDSYAKNFPQVEAKIIGL